MNNVVNIKVEEAENFETYLLSYVNLCQIPSTFWEQAPRW